MKVLKILRSAKRDLAEGFGFYEEQESGVGEYFIASLREEIQSLKVTGGTHRTDYREFHRLVCQTFPFAVYYIHKNETVTVYAVVDCRRDLKWLQQHLDETNR
jgi:plasmid stabilization system protein ParE